MKCPNCQSINLDDACFCTKCGQPLSNPVEIPQVSYCTTCGAPLEPGTNFCVKCGTPVSPSYTEVLEDDPPTEKKPLSPAAKFICIIALFLLFDCIIFAFILKDEIVQQKAITAEANALNEQISLYAEQISSAEYNIQNQEYTVASAELAEAISGYADIYVENNGSDLIVSHINDAYISYTETIQKQAAVLEEQPPSPEAYRQMEDTLAEAFSLVGSLNEKGFSIDSSTLTQVQENLSSIYKEKYIYLFNDLRTGEDWSYDTAWQYMTDAESILQWFSFDDPIGLRYAYTLAGITHQEIAAGLSDGSLSYSDAVSQILSVLESADYNPVLMVDLALYMDYTGDSQSASAIKNACFDVYNYLAYTENIYINPDDFLISGRTSKNASSTISLNDFYYFNDFGEYSISDTNGLSPEGRQYVRDVFKNAVAQN